MDAARDVHRVRTTFGLLMRHTVETRQPGVLAPVDAVLDEALASPLGMVSAAEACAVTAAIGTTVHRDLDVEPACARVLGDAIASQRQSPMVGTLMRVCDGHWPRFVRDYANWGKLVWTVPAEIEHTDFDAGSVQLTFASLASVYLSPGFWSGIMPCFELGDPTARVVERGSNWTTIGLRWRP